MTPGEDRDPPNGREPTGKTRMSRVLVVEDEAHLAAGLRLNLSLDGYSVTVATNGREAREALVHPDGFDVIVLDVMLPDLDGFELCRHLRDAGVYTPVLMLTARSSAEDRVHGLESGADDYMVKPFDLSELLARVRSLLRRRDWARSAAPRAPALVFGDGQRAYVDFDTHRVIVDGAPRTLTKLELELLRYFAANAGRVVSRDELLEHVWHVRSLTQSRTVDNFIMRLRAHFEVDPAAPRHFLSIRGVGYRFEP